MTAPAPIQSIASFDAYLSPNEVRGFSQSIGKANDPVAEFKTKFAGGFAGDPHPMKDLPFLTEKDHTWKQTPATDYLSDKLHTVTIWNNGFINLSKPGSSPNLEENATFHPAPVDIQPGGDKDLSIDNLKEYSKKRPLLVNPYAAVLTVYDPALANNQKVEVADFEKMREANERIADFIRKAGRNDTKLNNLFGMAVMMDTASRTPHLMAPTLIDHVMRFYGDYANQYGSKMWMGTGTEHLEGKQGLASIPSKVSIDEYIKARKKQIDMIATLNKEFELVGRGISIDPIIFPAQEQSKLSEAENIRIITELLEYAKGKGILHKLGSPFNPATDYITDRVVEKCTPYAQAVKSSVPLMNKLPGADFKDFSGQVQDYNVSTSITKSKLFTGDDRNFGLVWLWAANKELTLVKQRLEEAFKRGTIKPGDNLIGKGVLAETEQRNGFTFLRGVNAHALLGYIGLNPEQTAKAIIELSNWFYDSLEAHAYEIGGQNSAAPKLKKAADTHLENYFKIILPAMGMSTQAFFSPYNPTRSYTDYVTASHKLRGVDLKTAGGVEGKPLPHRRMIGTADGTTEQKNIIGQLLAWKFLSGTIDPRNTTAVKEVVTRARDAGMLSNATVAA